MIKLTIPKPYSVKFRLTIFVIMVVSLVVFISLTAIIGLNSTYNSLSELRDKSLNQMFYSMRLGVKNTQISTYATRLQSSFQSLEYKEASEQLDIHIQQVHNLLTEIEKKTTPKERQHFSVIIDDIENLENTVQELLIEANNRNRINTAILSKLNQSLLYIEHIKRLDKKLKNSLFLSEKLSKIEELFQQSSKGAFSAKSFTAIQSIFSFLPKWENEEISSEWSKVEKQFNEIINLSQIIEKINYKILFLTAKINTLAKKIDLEYTELTQDKIVLVNSDSDKIQTNLSKNISSIIIVSLFTILLTIITGGYIYRLFGKRLYSITQALTRLSQGEKNLIVPQQQSQDEIGDLARAFQVFQQMEEELTVSQKMRAIGNLTSSIAHDFNNFLAVIIGNLDLIEPHTLPDKQAKRLLRALKAAENSATLSQRLLAFARKQPLNPVSLNLNQLLIDFSDLMKHSLPPSISIKLDLGKNLSNVYMDKNQLETALVNLLVNAKDALNGEGEILIQTSEQLIQRAHRQERMLQLSVKDQGCGMDEQTRKRIFEPFFTTKQNGKGSGLGLSMVYGFIRQSGGRVVVESEVGKGTVMNLQLPISQEIEEKTDTSLLSISTITKGIHILLVEDQQVLRETLTEQLRNIGYSPTAVENAEQAINYLNNNSSIDFMLSDIVLNGKMNGIELAKFVTNYNPKIKILLMTGNYVRTMEKKTEFSILKKPFRLEELQQALEN